jgi:hypothetical protein
METKWNIALAFTLGVGLLGTVASAQNTPLGTTADARVQYAILNGEQAGTLQQADWDDHHRCDGDHDRDDRGCYYRDYDRDRYYGYSYYGNGYVAPYYYNAPPAGWYDRHGHWHAYDKDRDRDRRRHDDDDRR